MKSFTTKQSAHISLFTIANWRSYQTNSVCLKSSFVFRRFLNFTLHFLQNYVPQAIINVLLSYYNDETKIIILYE